MFGPPSRETTVQWSQLKTQVESRFASPLQGRVEIWSAVYRKPATADGRAWITLDGDQIWSMTDQPSDRAREELSRAMDEAEQTDPENPARVWTRQSAYFFTRGDFRTALQHFLHSSIDQLLESPHPLDRALAMLDARLGKRRFRRLSGIQDEHPLVQLLWQVRVDAEGWMPPVTAGTGTQWRFGRPQTTHRLTLRCSRHAAPGCGADESCVCAACG